VVFKALYARHIGGWDELYRREDVTMGYSTFIQYTLSRELIRHGVQQARAALPAGVNHPHFMPAQGGRPPKDPAASAIPKRCEFKHGDQIHFYDDAWNSTGTLGFSHCKQCYRELLPAISRRAGVSTALSSPDPFRLRWLPRQPVFPGVLSGVRPRQQ